MAAAYAKKKRCGKQLRSGVNLPAVCALLLSMKKIFTLLLLSLATAQLPAQTVVSVEDQGITLQFILNIALMGAATVDGNVQSYKLTYTTTDPFGQPDTATGLFSVPAVISADLPMVIYNHGTVPDRFSVPSVPGVLERFIVQAFAGNGYIAVAPDYLGLGGSDGIHPYLHAETQASAGRDMILAVQSWLAEQSIAQNGRLFLTGYSQGGHASMALHRNIQLEPGTDGLVVTAAAHLSGAYTIPPPSPALLGLTNIDPVQLSFFLNTIISYNFANNLYGGVDQLFKEPYLTEVQRFLADEIDLYEMGEAADSLLRLNNQLVAEMFADQFVTDVLDNDPTLIAAYTENTLTDWAPESPTLLYYCNADMTVSPLQSIVADSLLRQNGADSLYLEDGGAFNHGDCAIPAVVRALEFFDAYPLAYPVSLGEVRQRPDVVLTPNPVRAGDVIRFNGLEGQIMPFSVYDFSGRVALGGQTGLDGEIYLPATLPSGLFVVRIGLNDGTSLARKVEIR